MGTGLTVADVEVAGLEALTITIANSAPDGLQQETPMNNDNKVLLI